jgi:hypothetical protein
LASYVNLIQSFERVECQNPEHEGDRSVNGDLWIEWPDFIFRCHACHKRLKKVDNIPGNPDDDTPQE